MGLLNILKLYGLIAANVNLTFVSGIVLNTFCGLAHAGFSVLLSKCFYFHFADKNGVMKRFRSPNSGTYNFYKFL